MVNETNKDETQIKPQAESSEVGGAVQVNTEDEPQKKELQT